MRRISWLVCMLTTCALVMSVGLGPLPASHAESYDDYAYEDEDVYDDDDYYYDDDEEEEQPWGLSRASVTLAYDSSGSTVEILNASYYDDYEASSANESIATAEVSGDEVTITRKAAGITTVTVSDDSGTNNTIKVICKKTPFKLSSGSFTFSKKTKMYDSKYYEPAHVKGVAPDSDIVKARSSNRKVATVQKGGQDTVGYACVYPKKPGKAKITMWDQYGRKKTVTVKVKRNYFKASLKYSTNGYLYYGSKRASVYTKPKAKVTFKIGSEKHVKRANKYGYASIKLKHTYRLKKKYRVTAKWSKYKATTKGKIGSNTNAGYGTFYSCKYYVPVNVYNATKGDVVTLRAGNEKYKFKVPYTSSQYTHYFYLNYTLGNYRTLRTTVKNKYGQKLYDNTYTIRWR